MATVFPMSSWSERAAEREAVRNQRAADRQAKAADAREQARLRAVEREHAREERKAARTQKVVDKHNEETARQLDAAATSEREFLIPPPPQQAPPPLSAPPLQRSADLVDAHDLAALFDAADAAEPGGQQLPGAASSAIAAEPLHDSSSPPFSGTTPPPPPAFPIAAFTSAPGPSSVPSDERSAAAWQRPDVSMMPLAQAAQTHSSGADSDVAAPAGAVPGVAARVENGWMTVPAVAIPPAHVSSDGPVEAGAEGLVESGGDIDVAASRVELPVPPLPLDAVADRAPHVSNERPSVGTWHSVRPVPPPQTDATDMLSTSLTHPAPGIADAVRVQPQDAASLSASPDVTAGSGTREVTVDTTTGHAVSATPAAPVATVPDNAAPAAAAAVSAMSGWHRVVRDEPDRLPPDGDRAANARQDSPSEAPTFPAASPVAAVSAVRPLFEQDVSAPTEAAPAAPTAAEVVADVAAAMAASFAEQRAHSGAFEPGDPLISERDTVLEGAADAERTEVGDGAVGGIAAVPGSSSDDEEYWKSLFSRLDAGQDQAASPAAGAAPSGTSSQEMPGTHHVSSAATSSTLFVPAAVSPAAPGVDQAHVSDDEQDQPVAAAPLVSPAPVEMSDDFAVFEAQADEFAEDRQTAPARVELDETVDVPSAAAFTLDESQPSGRSDGNVGRDRGGRRAPSSAREQTAANRSAALAAKAERAAARNAARAATAAQRAQIAAAKREAKHAAKLAAAAEKEQQRLVKQQARAERLALKEAEATRKFEEQAAKKRVALAERREREAKRQAERDAKSAAAAAKRKAKPEKAPKAAPAATESKMRREQRAALKFSQRRARLAQRAELKEARDLERAAEKAAKESYRAEAKAQKDEKRALAKAIKAEERHRKIELKAELEAQREAVKLAKMRSEVGVIREKARRRALRDEVKGSRNANRDRDRTMKRAAKLGLEVSISDFDDSASDAAVVSTGQAAVLFDWQASDLPEPVPSR